MTSTEPRRTLAEHIDEALYAQAQRIIATLADDEHGRRVREELNTWYDTAYDRLSVELRAELTKSGRTDTRSTYAIVWLDTAAGRGELLRVRVRDLDDEHGRPVDARATARDLMAQLRPAPDHVPTDWTAEGGDAA